MGPFRAYANEPRSAIVIGVDKAGDLPILRAAKSGARQVARWLASEGFTVKLFVDDNGPVRVDDLLNAIMQIVRLGNQQQLVVYFAGHGFISAYSEYWLLSEAPENPNQAVSLNESVALARQSGIPNVVFISDACRSASSSLQLGRVVGGLIFPNSRSTPAVPSDVDLFLAALVGDPSYEIPVAQSSKDYEGIYTQVFLDAFKRPDATMIRTIDGQEVVPNYQLKGYLQREVPIRAEAASVRLHQSPDSIIMSGESSYIGKAAKPDIGGPITPQVATIFDVANAELGRSGFLTTQGKPMLDERVVRKAAIDTGFQEGLNAIALAKVLPFDLLASAATATPSSHVKCGFTIWGETVTKVTASDGVTAKIIEGKKSGTFVYVELSDNLRSTSVALRFSNGTGTVLAAFNNYLGKVVVDGAGVSSVSYVPAPNNSMWNVYLHEADRIAEMHAAVATSARFGLFRIEGTREQREKEAGRLADHIRVMKAIDPTLGIYAAYAYDDAGLPGKVESVAKHLKQELSADLFDVAMLAGWLEKPTRRPEPFIPMLAQGWGLLRVKGVQLPNAITDLPKHLIPSLWTTFDSEGMDIVESVLGMEEDLVFCPLHCRKESINESSRYDPNDGYRNNT